MNTISGHAIHAATKPQGHAITVRDNGIGIPREKLAEVKIPFSQAHQDPTVARAGTGLGLSIANALVEAHRGKLLIDSVAGKGTTVTVLLPAGDPGGDSAGNDPRRGIEA